MRIAMLTNSYKPYVAGVPISIERLVKGLRGLGHEVVVFAPSYLEQEEEEQGIVLLEAMAVGTPVLALKATGTEDVVRIGVGFFQDGVVVAEFTLHIVERSLGVIQLNLPALRPAVCLPEGI